MHQLPSILRFVRCALTVAAAVGFALPAASADWPHFRGPNRNGISPETVPANPWPGGEPKILWKADVGLGHSSFAVADGRAFTAGHADGTDTFFAFDARTGKLIWKHAYAAELGDKYYEGGTTGAPTVDGGRVYWSSKWGDVFCFNAADGKIIWSKQVQKETGAPVPTWGFTGGPLAHENLLILNIGEAGLALDKMTGAIVWKSDTKDAGYSSPLPVKLGDTSQVLLANTEHYLGLDPKTGRELWRHKWLTQYGVNAADPIVSGDRVFISSGYGKGGVMLDLSSGQPKEAWKTKDLRTQFNTAVLFEGHLYGTDGDTTSKAALKCLDFATGRVKWAQPNFGSGGIIIADGKLIALSGG
ncbi:MAG TPA: alcohol dehydrogenase [Verrucomicrobiales bacterium]|nr:alcohol dehydrogenase [Verrucomicrobiales bacterium]